MTDRVEKDEAKGGATVEADDARPRRQPYEAPTCEKKRSIHRVTLLSGMGAMSMAALGTTN
jgi:hypothetical protein